MLKVTISATDVPAKFIGPPLSVISDVTISVIDVNESPDDIRLIPGNVTIPENVSVGYCIAQVTSRNPERTQRVDYTLLNYQDTFAIEDKCTANSSVVTGGKKDLPYLTVKSHLSYDDYIIRGYKILIEAEDNGIPPQSFNGTVEVHVTKIDPCPSAACHVDATCSRVDWYNYTCMCNEGYTGDGFNCSDVDDCQPNPCSFGGTCHDYVNYYNCTCPSGYHNGTDCTLIDLCLSNPCNHSATCTPFRNGYSCFCAVGYTGVHCETNIDDCASEPCVEGACVDGVGSFTCNCSAGFEGTVCQRKPGECKEESCEKTEICVPPNVDKYNAIQCISSDAVVVLYFPEGEDASSPQWQYQLEQIIEGLTFPMTEVTKDEYDSSWVNVEDVFIISPSLTHTAKAKRSTSEDNPSVVEFVVIVKSDTKLVGVPVKAVLCSINNTCVNNKYITSGSPGDFNYRLCKSTAHRIEFLGISNCVPVEANDMPLKNQRHSTSMLTYYVIAGTGGLLLIVVLLGLLLCRRNRLSEKQRRFIKQERYRENDDETYTDIMYRHQMAKQEAEQPMGAFNPIYGTTEEEANRDVTMHDNPIYQEPNERKRVQRSESTTGFENPMYTSFKPDKLEQRKEEEELKAVGFANPMFTSYREVKN